MLTGGTWEGERSWDRQGLRGVGKWPGDVGKWAGDEGKGPGEEGTGQLWAGVEHTGSQPRGAGVRHSPRGQVCPRGGVP